MASCSTFTSTHWKFKSTSLIQTQEFLCNKISTKFHYTKINHIFISCKLRRILWRSKVEYFEDLKSLRPKCCKFEFEALTNISMSLGQNFIYLKLKHSQTLAHTSSMIRRSRIAKHNQWHRRKTPSIFCCWRFGLAPPIARIAISHINIINLCCAE